MSKPKSERVIFPRTLAVRILVRVLSQNEPLDEALAGVAGEIPSSVMPWLQEICSGTLRWKGRIDWILDSVSFKKKPSGWLRKILLLAIYQVVAQDRTPAAAVVSETVSEIKSKEGEFPAKFANACLRKISDQSLQWRNLAFPMDQPRDQAAWASMPQWMWSRWVKQQGVEWAKDYALASFERPVLWVRSKKELDPSLAQTGPVPSSWQVISGGAVTEKPGFLEGDFIVQDISSQFLIAEISQLVKARVSKDKPNAVPTALDLCAAPGGKSVGLAWSGFRVTSTDKLESRIPLLKETVKRAAPEVQVVSWERVWNQTSTRSDSTQPDLTWPDLTWPDLTWVDAPCTGTGILRRHPDVRWLRSEKEVEGLVQTQRQLLKDAWEKVPPGRFLAYSVCSLLKEEGPEAIQSLGLDSFVVNQWLLCPQKAPHGDGFWAALLYKNESAVR